MKRPEVDLSDCSMCGICIDVCSAIFKMNDAGYVEVLYLDDYSEKEIDEAIKNCREGCISWKEVE